MMVLRKSPKQSTLARTVMMSGAALVLLTGCADNKETAETAGTAAQSAQSSSAAAGVTAPELTISFEKFTLENGLDVVLHVDRSDPVVAIDLAAHVGSAREVEGRTGFAHLFEHLLFLDSENLGYGGLDEMNTRIGGDGTNGFTTEDMTQYFQAVPADALEKIIWAEADKLGWFINTVTQDVVDNEKQVVKNEKRQRVDNQPYGHNFYVINKNLYPDDHPYNWQVIGSLADLDAAGLQDVKDFYKRWYVPNNVTVTITGDFDTAQAKRLVEKYFGDIPRGDDVAPLEKRAGVLEESKSLYHEDNFATVPRLTMVWPAVEEYHPDAYALDVLMEYLSNGKRAPLNAVMIDEEKVTSGITMFNYSKEIAGELYLFVDANPGEDIDGLLPALEKAFDRFETNGISEDDLNRIKAGLEVSFYDNLQSVLGKAIQLGEYNLFTGDPGYVTQDIGRLLAVTPNDVMRVYEKYMKDKPYIATSFVPKGSASLALDGAIKANIVEEPIVQGAETEIDFDPTARTFEPTFSSFDRTIEPEFGEAYVLPEPVIWRDIIGSDISVYGIENDETPLVYFSLAFDAGRSRGDASKPAVANLTADMLSKGTKNKTTAQLEDAIKALGSGISISAGDTGTFVNGNSLARNFEATVALLEEMLLEPRWDESEFETLKRRRISEIEQAAGDPGAISRREAAKLLYPENHIYRYLAYGTKEKLEAVTLDDLKAFYAATYRPTNVRLRVVGDVNKSEVAAAWKSLADRWQSDPLDPVSLPQAIAVESSKVYFYDVPGAKQSVLRIERPSLDANDPDLAKARAVNFLLGDIYTSRLNTELRVNKGYTYGIGSGFSPSTDRGFFRIASSVRTNVTLESLALIRKMVEAYGPSFSEEDLTVMKSALLRGEALKTETLNAKLSVLGDISTFGYPDNYRKRNAADVNAMTLEEFKAVAEKYLRTDAMNWLVVGDATSQAERLKELGFGDPVMLNKE